MASFYLIISGFTLAALVSTKKPSKSRAVPQWLTKATPAQSMENPRNCFHHRPLRSHYALRRAKEKAVRVQNKKAHLVINTAPREYQGVQRVPLITSEGSVLLIFAFNIPSRLSHPFERQGQARAMQKLDEPGSPWIMHTSPGADGL